MRYQASLLLVASAAVTNAAVHRHGHRKYQPRDVVYVETDTVTETDWVTVTMGGDAPTSTSSLTTMTTTMSLTSVSTSSTSVATIPMTTMATSIKPVLAVQASSSTTSSTTSPTTSSTVVVVTPSTTPAPAPAPAPTTSTTAAAATTTSPAVVNSANKRGAAYNTASLVTPLLASGSKISWGYNWGQTRDGLASNLDYVPMLWGDRSGFPDTWATNAALAISSGSTHLLSINEPDNAGQSNMSPAQAAAFHITHMNPFAGSAKIGSPAITNSGSAGEGTDWLSQWVSACNGACQFDFCAAHWYSEPDKDNFLNYLQQVNTACQGKPVWLTEFAPTGDASVVNPFLDFVMDKLDNDSTYSFVERYSYFMVADGILVSGGSPSAIGAKFANVQQ